MGKHGRRSATGAKAKVPRALRRQTALKYLKPQFSSESVAEKWNAHRSAKQNLSALGLAHNPNMAVAHGQPSMGNVAPVVGGEAAVDPCELFVIPTGAGSDLVKASANPKRQAKAQGEDDQKYAARLLRRHGDDFTAMARDMKLNNRQLTPKQCLRVCGTFLSQTSEQRLVDIPANAESLIVDTAA